MQKNWLVNILAVVALVSGSWWLVLVLWPLLVDSVISGVQASDLLFFVTIIPLMTLPAILAVVFAGKLLKDKNPQNLRNVIGILMVAVAIVLSFMIEDRLAPLLPKATTGLPDVTAGGIALLIATLIAVFLYAWLATWALRMTGYPVRRAREVLSRLPFVLIAIQLFFVSSDLIRTYAPKQPGYAHVPELGWGIASFAGPLVATILLYKLATWACGIPQRERTATVDP